MNGCARPRPVKSGRIPSPSRTSSPPGTKLTKPTSSPSSTTARKCVRRAGIGEELDAARVGRRVVPLVRELVPPLRDRCGLVVAQRLDVHGSDPTFATHRAAASIPRRAASSTEPPSRKPAANASPAPVGSTASTSSAAKSSRESPSKTAAAAGAALQHAGRSGEIRAAQQFPLRLGREEDVGRELVEELAEADRPEAPDLVPCRDIDRDARARLPREPRREERRRADRLAHERVAGDVEDVAREPRGVELLRRERRRHAAVGRERAVAGLDDRDDDAGRARSRPARGARRRAHPARARRALQPGRRRASRCTPRRRRAPPPTPRRSPPGRRHRRASPRARPRRGRAAPRAG